MTNRQIAAQMVANGLRELRVKIKETPCSVVARIGGKQRTTQGATDKVRDFAVMFLDPWLARVNKLANPTPRADKSASTDQSTPEASGSGE
jgi:hypothetical protein